MRLVTLDEVPNADGQPLFVDFVNTLHWYEGAPIELIGSKSDFAAWLAERGLPATDLKGSLPEVHRFREHLRGLTEALASRRALPPADLDALESALSGPTGTLRLVEPGSAESHLGFAIDADATSVFNFQIALSIALFLRSPQRKRLKLCANSGCGFAFVDTSINATRRWCFMRYCGNRVKVRAFRGRQRAGHRTS
jgi:predicted RNA-binding Zn ribbon-like protein